MSRRIYGEWQNNLPSRFINEIPSNTLNIYNPNGFYPNKNPQKEKDWSNDSYSTFHTNNTPKKPHRYVGVRVYHEDYGFGKIVDVSGQTCEVEFEEYGRKKILGSYLRRA